MNCNKFHTEKDHRRPPYSRDSRNELTYSYRAVYINDFSDEKECMNWIQYIYHPEVYKTKKCQNQQCFKTYCPYLHKSQNYRREVKVKVNKEKENNVYKQKMMMKIGELQDLRGYRNMQKYERQLEEGKKNIMQKKQLMQRREEEENKKAVQIKKHIHQLGNHHSLQKVKSQVQYKQFRYGEQLDLLQDRHHEFKMFKNKDHRQVCFLVLEYICAFLNSEGGTIYLGINDDSIVYGLEVSQKWIDQLLLSIDNDGKLKMTPPLIPQKYRLRVIPVRNKKKLWLNVIEIKVYPASKYCKKILNLYNHEGFIRMNASNHRLSASDIMEYMRVNSDFKISQTINSREKEVEEMEEQELRQLQSTMSKLNQKIESRLRKKQRQ